jgi:hypothetical protein
VNFLAPHQIAESTDGKRLEFVLEDGEMRKRKHIGRKEKRQSKAAEATTPSRAAAKLNSGSSLAELEFKPIQIRGEPLSVTVLRDRR